MWTYQKKLQYPIKIATPSPALAKVIISQLGGPNCNGRWLGKNGFSQRPVSGGEEYAAGFIGTRQKSRRPSGHLLSKGNSLS